MARVLLVEDDESLSETVKQWLLFEKHAVETAATGYDAIEQLRFGEFDIVLMDWQLPEMTGIEICKQYRAGGGKTPIMMLSGNDSAAERQMGLDSGANDYMRKPFKLKDLSERMNKLINAVKPG
ncbi:MAG TPA: response regulator transcription factor [Drouetiella sp.]|jgi:DNA-binding response OmpR family regulator